MNLAELFVRISGDASSLKKATAESEKSLSRIGQAGERLNKVMLGVGAALAGAFAAQKIAAFASASVRAAAEADVVWNRLGGTLKTVGVEFESVRGNIERAASALERTTTVGDEEFAETLQTLVRITGDYSASLAEVATVADLAAGAQIDLDTAAQLVGKAMIGQTGTLARYGIVVEDGADAMKLLRDRFREMAANEAKTLQGKVTQLSNAWGNLKEAIGEALASTVNGQSVLDTFIEKVQGATRWVEDHNEALHTWGELLGDILTKSGRIIDFVAAYSVMAKETPWWMEPFTPLPDFDFLSGAALERDTFRNEGARLGGGGTRPTPAAAAAAEAAAERFARLLEIAADATSAVDDAMADLAAATRQRAHDELWVIDRYAAMRGTMLGGAPKLDLNLRPGVPAPTASAESLGSQLGGLVSQVTGLSASLGPLAVAAMALKPVFDGFMEALGPALSALAEPLRMIGRILGSTLAPILKVLEKPLFALSQLVGIIVEALAPLSQLLIALTPSIQLLTPLIELLGRAMSYVTEAIGWFIKALGQFVDKIVPDWISKAGKGLAEMGDAMMEQARAFRKGEIVFGELTETTKDLASSMSNVPSIFANALRRFQASTAGIPGGSASNLAIAGGASVTVSGPVTVVANNPEEFARAMEDYGAKVEWRGGYSRWAAATG
jgi:hypothetical protein